MTAQQQGQAFGDRLKALREKAGESQADLAREIGVDVGAVSAYETHRRLPRAETVVAIGDHYGVSLDHLLRGDTLEDHTEHPAFHRFLATDYGIIARKRGWLDLLRKLPLPYEPTVKTYKNIVHALLSEVEDPEEQ